MGDYLPHTEKDIEEMLEEIGVDTFEDLLEPVPEEVRFEGQLNVPEALSEQNLLEHVRSIAEENRDLTEYTSFLGAGMYHHYIPAVVEQLTARNEFYTTYTPYQAEASQGILQAFYEFQSMISLLTGMDISNASLYDGPTALAEAVLMVAGNTEGEICVPASLHPHYREVLETYLQFHPLTVRTIPAPGGTVDTEVYVEAMENAEVEAIILQNPNFYGALEPVQNVAPEARSRDIPVVGVVEPISLYSITPPGEWPADVAVGEGQPLGNDLYYGGPTFGFMATEGNRIRELPGRVIGRTSDDESGRNAYIMTLQTREQHIRREKATSNICTNQGLNALRATIWLSTLGKEGVRRVAEHSLQKAHYLKDRLLRLDGFSDPFPDATTFHEFTLNAPLAPEQLNNRLLEHDIIGGLDISDDHPDLSHSWLLATTEWHTKEELDNMIRVVTSMV